MCVCLSLSQWVRRVGDSSNWSACVLLHSRHASHCTILLISSALCTCTHTHKLSHFFTVSLTAFRHGVTPHFAHRFAHTIALLVCLCVCRRAAGVMDCRSKWRHMDICSVHPIKVSRIRWVGVLNVAVCDTWCAWCWSAEEHVFLLVLCSSQPM